MKEEREISTTIEKDVSDVSMSFDMLRQEALDIVQKYSGEEWTDFNIHDPGVTILEALCFALTDLSFRTGFPLNDILSDTKGNLDYEDQSFHLPTQILNTHPVLINDYRKLVIDQIDEIQNVWIKPFEDFFGVNAIRGLFSVSLQLTVKEWQFINNLVSEDEKEIRKSVNVNAVRNLLLKNRMIGNDFFHFKIIDPKKIKISAKISINSIEPPEEILAEIFWAFNNFLNPYIEYTSPNIEGDVTEPLTEIFNGPTLKKGVIKDDSLRNLPKQIEPTEFTRLAGVVKGVLNVISLSVSDGNITTFEEPLILKEGEFGLINPLVDFNHIEFLRDGAKVVIRKQYFVSYYNKLLYENDTKFPGYSYIFSEKMSGQYRNIHQYHSIQHHFPMVYGIGAEGISSNAPDEQKAAVKQLQAYLLIFEQLMGNYLKQLSFVDKLFSYKIDSTYSHTYYSQPVLDVPGINHLVSFISMLPEDKRGQFQMKQYEAAISKYQQTLNRLIESDSDYVERKNSFLDHMLSRFNFSLNSYPIELSDHYYQLKNLHRNDEKIRWKSDFLQHIVPNTSNRARGSNYHSTDKNNSFDFIHLIYKLLFIQNKPFSQTANFIVKAEGNMIDIDRAEKDKSDLDTKLVLLDEVITVRNQTRQGSITNNYSPDDNLLIFELQDEIVFKDACNFDNYKVSPNVFTNIDYVILYNQIDEKEWRVVGYAKTVVEAKEKIQKSVSYFINLSLNTEGIHVLENILLRPDVTSASYGFNFFLDDKKTVSLLKSNNWLSINDRNNLISYVQELTEINDLTDKEKLEILNKYFDIIGLKGESIDQTSPENISLVYTQIQSVFENFKKNDFELVNERIQLLVRYPNGFEIDESIFDFKLNFFIPAWPARFQDDNFRIFLHKIILEYTPAHLKFDLHFLSIEEMAHFESLYFTWISLLQANNGTEFQKLSSEIIKFLNKS